MIKSPFAPPLLYGIQSLSKLLGDSVSIMDQKLKSFGFRWVFPLILSSVMGPFSAAASGNSALMSCSQALDLWDPPAWEGKLVLKKDEQTIRFLGGGLKGGRVYLVEQAYRQKIWKDYVGVTSLKNDLGVWTQLKKWLTPEMGLVIPRHRAVGEKRLELEYIPTTDLRRLSVSQQNLSQLRLWDEAYGQLIEGLQQKLGGLAGVKVSVFEDKNEVFFRAILAYEFKNDEGAWVQGMVKANNLGPMPGAPGKFILFDPY